MRTGALGWASQDETMGAETAVLKEDVEERARVRTVGHLQHREVWTFIELRNTSGFLCSST